jgi:hypothetical protein
MKCVFLSILRQLSTEDDRKCAGQGGSCSKQRAFQAESDWLQSWAVKRPGGTEVCSYGHCLLPACRSTGRNHVLSGDPDYGPTACNSR